MSMLAIDIETASPHSNPSGDMQNTDHFELVAIGAGYQDRPDGPIDTEVFFRDGDWGIYHTTELLTRVVNWAKEHNPNYAITYNGDHFDKTHLLNWAEAADSEYKTTNLATAFEKIFNNHIDLIRPAAATQDGSGRSYLKLEDALDNVDIPVEKTYYENYDLPAELDDSFELPYVQNVDIGKHLGEAYVEHIAAPEQSTDAYSDLQPLLYDYTAADIEPLFALAEELRQTI